MVRDCATIHCRGLGVLVALLVAGTPGRLAGVQLTVKLQNASGVTFVGAVNRWDVDGNPRRPVDPKAKINSPFADATARQVSAGTWVFQDLAPGTYDLILLAEGGLRIEGFYYPPVLEFDPFIKHADRPPEKACAFIRNDIAQSRHYENKVVPLFFAGDEKQVRVLVQLLRDKPTSYDAAYGEQVATLRHEVWQYTGRYGAWMKEKRTKVLDRILMAKRMLRTWTWVWEPTLGGIEIQQQPVVLQFAIPHQIDASRTRGLLPY